MFYYLQLPVGACVIDRVRRIWMRRVLHFQADRIELVLASHRVPARVTGGTVTPRLVRYQLSTPFGVRVKQVAGLAEEIALSLGAPMCRVYRKEGEVQVEVPRADAQAVGLHRIAGDPNHPSAHELNVAGGERSARLNG